MDSMITNNIRERRTARGWSMNSLAQEVGTTVQTINRIETGETKLMHELVPKLAAVFGVTWPELFNTADAEKKVFGFADEVAPFIPAMGDPLGQIDLGENRDLWFATSAALDAIGIGAGQPMVVNISQDVVDRATSLDPVIVQLIDAHNPLRGSTLLRQFIEPDLFITNSRTENAEPLNRSLHDVRIKGLIERVIVRPGFGR